MSSDRTTEILNYLSAISRDVGELRQDVRDVAGRLDRIESDVRAVLTRLDRMEAKLLEQRAGHRELEDRVAAVERK